MCVNNLPRVAFDSGEAGIWTRDTVDHKSSIPTTQPPRHTIAGYVTVNLMTFDKQSKHVERALNTRQIEVKSNNSRIEVES